MTTVPAPPAKTDEALTLVTSDGVIGKALVARLLLMATAISYENPEIFLSNGVEPILILLEAALTVRTPT